MELPDFHIPHAEKIEWMIETNGWALEAIAPRADTDPPTPAYAYTIGVPAAVGLPGGRRVRADAGRGQRSARARRRRLSGRHRDPARCRGGRPARQRPAVCVRSRRPRRLRRRSSRPPIAWYRGEPFELVQLLYPDRNGFMPYEVGYDQRMRLAQPVLGTLDDDA